MPFALEISALAGGPPPPHKRWTRDECAVLEKAGLFELQRYELLEGELVLKTEKNHPHMRAVLLLAAWLRQVYGQNFVVQEPAIDVRPEDNPSSEPEPDAIVLNRSFLELTSRARPEELLLVAEVFSTTLAFDLTAKARLYARAGIAEYWVLDLEGRRLIVHLNPVEGAYRSVTAYDEDELVSTLSAPANEVRVGELL